MRTMNADRGKIRRWWLHALSVALLLAVSGPSVGTATAANATFWVNDNPSGSLQNQNCERPFSTSIQAAVIAAPAGSRIRVCDGTYSEQVEITKTLTVEGAGVSKTIIQAPPVLAPGTAGDKTIVTMAGPAEIEFSRFTVRGPGPAGCNSITFGIFARDGAKANIHDNAILDIRDQPFSGCQNGVAIQVGRQAFSTIATAIIEKNVIAGFQKNGITVDNVGSSATINDNTITGSGPTSIIAQNGIQVGRGANASVEKNDISNLQYAPQTVASTGILIFETGKLDILKNKIARADENIYAQDINGQLLIRLNDLTQATFDGLGLLNTDNARIENNRADENGFDGIFVDSDSAGNAIENNKMKNNEEHDCHDNSVGPGTGGTANSWINDKGETQNRPDLCKKAEVTGAAAATARVTSPGTATRVGPSSAK